MIITIDGPAASGKSTVAQGLAQRLGIKYLYTGYLYRAVAYVYSTILHKKIDNFVDEDAACIVDIDYRYDNGNPRIWYREYDITRLLKDPSLDQAASMLSSKSAVRAALLDVQRDIAQKFDIVADGRDCGSVVFPHAEHKFFLTASSQERARRKARESGMSYDDALEELRIRDERDTTRSVAPLIIPEDATVIDNTNMSIDETVQKMLQMIEK